MELRAVFEALSAVPPQRPLIIETDSQYVINIFTVWLQDWKRRGWRTSSKKPVQNQRAIQEVERLLVDRSVEWHHVPGHAGHRLNEIVDMHARAAATAVKNHLAVDEGPGCTPLTNFDGEGSCK